MGLALIIVVSIVVSSAIPTCVLVAIMPPTERVRNFARAWRLPVTPEVAPWIAQRLLVKTISVLATYWLLILAVIVMLVVATGNLRRPQLSDLALWNVGLVVLFMIRPIASVVGHLTDASIVGQRPGSRVARLSAPRLADFIPEAVIWVIRATWLLPALAMTAWLTIPPGASARLWPRHFSPAVWLIALAAPIVGALVEAWQWHIVRGPQRASNGLELAYDDAFRASTVHQMSMIGVFASALGAGVIAGSALAAGHGAFRLFFGVAEFPTVFAIFIYVLMCSPRVRVHYLTRLAPSAVAPPSMPTVAPAAS